MADDFGPYKDYNDWYDNGPGSESFKHKSRKMMIECEQDKIKRELTKKIKPEYEI